MTKLLVVFAAALVLAYLSQQNTKATLAAGRRYSVWGDWAYLALVVVLTLFAGLRTSYNDTGNYIAAYRTTTDVVGFFSDLKNLNPFKNPLFYLFQSIMKTVTDDYQWVILITSLLAQSCFLRFFKGYSNNFLFSVFIYFTLGTFAFTLAAIKQVTAMAIATLAFPYLEKKKWLQYWLIILAAMLVHTYAVAFAVLPFFRVRPWRTFTFLFIASVALLMLNFEEAITAFMDQANDLGKTIAEYEVFDNATVNLFRLAVYAVPPVISLVFQRWVLHRTDAMDHVLVHMSIISLAFMTMGTQSGANMFGRMGNYFELGTICILPWMLEQTFDKRSYRLISSLAVIAFLGFFAYANLIATNFDQVYRSVGLLELLASLFTL